MAVLNFALRITIKLKLSFKDNFSRKKIVVGEPNVPGSNPGSDIFYSDREGNFLIFLHKSVNKISLCLNGLEIRLNYVTEILWWESSALITKKGQKDRFRCYYKLHN